MRQKDNEKYGKIIGAATKIFAKKGFYKAKVSEIAKEAGVADGTIYIYFSSFRHRLEIYRRFRRSEFYHLLSAH